MFKFQQTEEKRIVRQILQNRCKGETTIFQIRCRIQPRKNQFNVFTNFTFSNSMFSMFSDTMTIYRSKPIVKTSHRSNKMNDAL